MSPLRNFKLPSSHIKGEIKFNTTFQKTQYAQNIISSMCNQYKNY